MTLKVRLVRGLLRLYPAGWRKEYGDEMEDLLLTRPVTASVIGDVLLNAARQHLRRNTPWKMCGAFLAAWSLFWLAWNSIAPLAPGAYALFTRVDGDLWIIVCLAAGYWTRLRGEKGVWDSASAAPKAALTGIIPELTLLILNTAGILPQILIDIYGHPHPNRPGIALLHTRGPVDGVLGGIPLLIFVSPCFIVVFGETWGLFGALLGRAVMRNRRPPSRAVR